MGARKGGSTCTVDSIKKKRVSHCIGILRDADMVFVSVIAAVI